MIGKKKDWEIEVDHILKDATVNSRLKAFAERLEQEKIEPPEEWQEVFNTFFEELIGELPALACCILAFKAGAVWQKDKEGLDAQLG